LTTMKPTVSHIERLLAKIEDAVPRPRKPVLTVIIHELREGESREKVFAEMAARYPQNVAGKTVDDFNWSDDLVGAQEKVVAEHIAVHPEHAGCTVKDFAWIIREIVSPKWRLENGRAVFPTIDTESEELTPWDERNGGGIEGEREELPARGEWKGNGHGNGGGEWRSSDPDLSALPTPGRNERGLDGGPDHHRSGAVLSFAAGLKERSRRLGRPLQPRQLRRR
jgi:hypothetical protein